MAASLSGLMGGDGKSSYPPSAFGDIVFNPPSMGSSFQDFSNNRGAAVNAVAGRAPKPAALSQGLYDAFVSMSDPNSRFVATNKSQAPDDLSFITVQDGASQRPVYTMQTLIYSLFPYSDAGAFIANVFRPEIVTEDVKEVVIQQYFAKTIMPKELSEFGHGLGPTISSAKTSINYHKVGFAKSIGANALDYTSNASVMFRTMLETIRLSYRDYILMLGLFLLQDFTNPSFRINITNPYEIAKQEYRAICEGIGPVNRATDDPMKMILAAASKNLEDNQFYGLDTVVTSKEAAMYFQSSVRTILGDGRSTELVRNQGLPGAVQNPFENTQIRALYAIPVARVARIQSPLTRAIFTPFMCDTPNDINPVHTFQFYSFYNNDMVTVPIKKLVESTGNMWEERRDFRGLTRHYLKPLPQSALDACGLKREDMFFDPENDLSTKGMSDSDYIASAGTKETMAKLWKDLLKEKKGPSGVSTFSDLDMNHFSNAYFLGKAKRFLQNSKIDEVKLTAEIAAYRAYCFDQTRVYDYDEQQAVLSTCPNLVSLAQIIIEMSDNSIQKELSVYFDDYRQTEVIAVIDYLTLTDSYPIGFSSVGVVTDDKGESPKMALSSGLKVCTARYQNEDGIGGNDLLMMQLPNTTPSLSVFKDYQNQFAAVGAAPLSEFKIPTSDKDVLDVGAKLGAADTDEQKAALMTGILEATFSGFKEVYAAGTTERTNLESQIASTRGKVLLGKFSGNMLSQIQLLIEYIYGTDLKIDGSQYIKVKGIATSYDGTKFEDTGNSQPLEYLSPGFGVRPINSGNVSITREVFSFIPTNKGTNFIQRVLNNMEKIATDTPGSPNYTDFIKNMNNNSKFESVYELGFVKCIKRKVRAKKILTSITPLADVMLQTGKQIKNEFDVSLPQTWGGKALGALLKALKITAGEMANKVGLEKATYEIKGGGKTEVFNNDISEGTIVMQTILGFDVKQGFATDPQNREIKIAIPANYKQMLQRMRMLDGDNSESLLVKGIAALFMMFPMSRNTQIRMAENGCPPVMRFPLFTFNIILGHTIIFCASGGVTARITTSGIREKMFPDEHNGVYHFRSEAIFGGLRLPNGPSTVIEAAIIYDFIGLDGNQPAKDLSIINNQVHLSNDTNVLGYFTAPFPNLDDERLGDTSGPLSLFNAIVPFTNSNKQPQTKRRNLAAPYFISGYRANKSAFSGQKINSTMFARRDQIETATNPMAMIPYVIPNNCYYHTLENKVDTKKVRKINPLWDAVENVRDYVVGSAGRPSSRQALPVRLYD